jgi:Phage head-tail joining protein
VNTYGDAVTIVRAPLVDGYGGQRVRDWAAAERLVGVAASVQPLRSTEATSGRQVVTTDKNMHTGTDVYETDRVEWGGETYDVVGVEGHRQGGVFDHYECVLRLHTEAAS